MICLKVNRIFLTVLDSFGIGAMPDARKYGDEGSYTLKSIFDKPEFRADNLAKMGLFNIDGVDFGKKEKETTALYARLEELSFGKDTTTGHWEIAGEILKKPFPTYPEGFGDDIIKEFIEKTGRGVLCNKPYSGTEVLNDFGKEHIKTGKLIVYTSADSVFQIAAHEDIISPEELYRYCEIAREIMTGENGVARIIARPFGGNIGNFYRTPNRRDFSLAPPSGTMLDKIKFAGLKVISIGKIDDIFSHQGITKSYHTKNNEEGIKKLSEVIDMDFNGLCFTNLVDFDMVYGHRRDVRGYASAISYFDEKLGELKQKLKDGDVLIITADHGCDPEFKGTDHTREYVPLLIYSNSQVSKNLGTIQGFDCVADTVCDLLEIGENNSKSLKEYLINNV